MPSRIAWSRALRLLGVVAICAIASFGARGADSPLPRIVVSVPGPHNLSYLPLDLVSKIGADREAGVKLQLLHVGGGSVALGNLLNHNADFAVAGLPAILSLRANGGKAVGIAAVNDMTLFVFMVRSQLRGQVKRFADLKGRIVGVSTSSLSSKTTSQQLLEILLEQDGVDPRMVRILPAGLSWADQSALIDSGMVDAIMGTEPFASRLLAENKVFFLANLASPDVAGKIPGAGFLHATLATRADLIENDPQKVAKMVGIMRRTLQWIASHTPEEFVEKLEIRDASERAALRHCLRRYPRLYSQDGRFSSEQVRQTETFFRATAADHPAARSLKAEDVVSDQWAGRKK